MVALLGITISPPFGSWMTKLIARSISLASLTPPGINRTPKDAASMARKYGFHDGLVRSAIIKPRLRSGAHAFRAPISLPPITKRKLLKPVILALGRARDV